MPNTNGHAANNIGTLQEIVGKEFYMSINPSDDGPGFEAGYGQYTPKTGLVKRLVLLGMEIFRRQKASSSESDGCATFLEVRSRRPGKVNGYGWSKFYDARFEGDHSAVSLARRLGEFSEFIFIPETIGSSAQFPVVITGRAFPYLVTDGEYDAQLESRATLYFNKLPYRGGPERVLSVNL